MKIGLSRYSRIPMYVQCFPTYSFSLLFYTFCYVLLRVYICCVLFLLCMLDFNACVFMCRVGVIFHIPNCVVCACIVLRRHPDILRCDGTTSTKRLLATEESQRRKDSTRRACTAGDVWQATYGRQRTNSVRELTQELYTARADARN
jgi:hypothetical protein